MVRVFYLTSEFLWPPHHGGRVRSLSQLRILASLPEVEAVTVLSLTETEVPPADLVALCAEVPRARVLRPVFHPVHLRQHPRWIPRVLGLRLLGVPYLAAKWDGTAVRTALREALGADHDVVYIDHLGMARYLGMVRRLCPRARIVVEAHNVESDLFRQFADRHRGPLRLLGLAEWRATQRFERAVLRAADAVVAISPDDAEKLRTQTGALPIVVPQVMPLHPRPRPAPLQPQLGYVGNLTWHPNVRGLDWFCEEVWPRIRTVLPEARLCIAGSGLPSAPDGRPLAPARWRAPGVEVLGFLPDLEPLYESSAALVAPILGGSGVRIKLLEALRAGVPAVTTPAGAAGLPLRDGEEVLIEEDPARFAEAALRLLRDGALRDRLREGGYRFLAARHGPAAAEAALRKALGLPPPAGT